VRWRHQFAGDGRWRQLIAYDGERSKRLNPTATWDRLHGSTRKAEAAVTKLFLSNRSDCGTGTELKQQTNRILETIGELSG
jgi:hypothetical protein